MELILFVLFAHWLADFFFQSHWMASNKSKSNVALLAHTVTYTYVWALLIGLVNANLILSWQFWAFLGITFIAHTVTDYYTSRWTACHYKNGDIHNLFVVVGIDQALHYAQLFWTIKYLANTI